MTIHQLLQNHHNVIGYLAGLAEVLVRVSSTTLNTDALAGELPEGTDPEAVLAEVQADMVKMATVLRGAAEVLSHPGVMGIAVLEATRGGQRLRRRGPGSRGPVDDAQAGAGVAARPRGCGPGVFAVLVADLAARAERTRNTKGNQHHRK